MSAISIRVARPLVFAFGLAIFLIAVIGTAYLAISFLSVQDDVRILSHRVEEMPEDWWGYNDSFMMAINVTNTGVLPHSPVILTSVVTDSQTYQDDLPYFYDLQSGETRNDTFRIRIPNSVLQEPHEMTLSVRLEPFSRGEERDVARVSAWMYAIGTGILLFSFGRVERI